MSIFNILSTSLLIEYIIVVIARKIPIQLIVESHKGISKEGVESIEDPPIEATGPIELVIDIYIVNDIIIESSIPCQTMYVRIPIINRNMQISISILEMMHILLASFKYIHSHAF